MQLITVLSIATSMVATASARSAVTLNEECDTSKPMARVHNQCSYDVYLWSVYKGDGCPSDEMVTLKAGETYQENYADPEGGDTGVSIKLSKTQDCKANSIAQLEYFLQTNSPGFNYNYLDVSYVDCASDDADCPTRQEGYKLVAGDQTGANAAASDNTWCPVMSCTGPASCNLISYVLPNDVQTKSCDTDQNMDFYMCGSGGEDSDSDSGSSSSAAPSSSAAASSSAVASSYAANSSSAAAPSSSEAAATSYEQATSTQAQASSSAAASSSTEDSYEADLKVAAAAVTPAAQYNAKTKTEVVYVTAYQTINAKRHAHGHARRHQQFHA